MKLIEINKITYALGIEWRLRYNQKAKDIVKSAPSDFDCYVLSEKQVGYLVTNKNPRYLKSLSLVASLKIPEKSFLGIFMLKDIHGEIFYSLICFHNGYVVGLGDSIFATKEEAESKIPSIQDLLNSKIENIVKFDTLHDSLFFLQDRLPKKTLFPKHQIKALYKSKSSNIKLGVLAVSIVAIPMTYFAVTNFLEYRTQQNIIKERALFLQSKEEKKLELQNNAENIFPQSWKNQYQPVDSFRICQNAMFELPIVENNWLIHQVVCNGKAVNTTWAWQNQADYINLPFDGNLKGTKEVTSKHVLNKIDIDKAQKIESSHSEFLTKNDITKLLYQLTQDMGTSLKLKFDDVSTRYYEDLELTISAPWRRGKFTLEPVPASLLLNDSLFKHLQSLPSLYITEIKYDHALLAWSIQGEFYVQP